MDAKEKSCDLFIQKKRRLTQWFLFTLLFNLFLQFDFVENYLNSASDSYSLTQRMDICGESSIMSRPASEDGLLKIAVSPAITPPNSHKLKALNTRREAQANFGGSQSPIVLTVKTYTPKPFVAHFSGLSPPKA